MSRYIDLDDDRVVFCGNDGDYERYNIPEDLPSSDVVEVVRCEKCRFSSYDFAFNKRWCNSVSGCRQVKDDGFCDRGKAKR